MALIFYESSPNRAVSIRLELNGPPPACVARRPLRLGRGHRRMRVPTNIRYTKAYACERRQNGCGLEPLESRGDMPSGDMPRGDIPRGLRQRQWRSVRRGYERYDVSTTKFMTLTECASLAPPAWTAATNGPAVTTGTRGGGCPALTNFCQAARIDGRRRIRCQADRRGGGSELEGRPTTRRGTGSGCRPITGPSVAAGGGNPRRGQDRQSTGGQGGGAPGGRQRPEARCGFQAGGWTC